MRTSSVGTHASPSPSASQSMQSLNQPWLSSGPQGKPPLPSPSYRQQLNPQSMQQRSHISQQQQPMPTTSQQQPPLPSNQSQEHLGQQVPPSRALHVPHQQQVTRLQGPGNQKPSSLVAAQSGAAQPGIQSRLANADTDEPCNSVLSKRSIHELVNQVRHATSLCSVDELQFDSAYGMQYGIRQFRVENFTIMLLGCFTPSFMNYVPYVYYIYISALLAG